MINSRLRQDLPISINERVILPFHESLIFTKLALAKFRENNILSKISEFTVFRVLSHNKKGLDATKPVFGVPNQSSQLQRLARLFKFRSKRVYIMIIHLYYYITFQ